MNPTVRQALFLAHRGIGVAIVKVTPELVCVVGRFIGVRHAPLDPIGVSWERCINSGRRSNAAAAGLLPGPIRCRYRCNQSCLGSWCLSLHDTAATGGGTVNPDQVGAACRAALRGSPRLGVHATIQSQPNLVTCASIRSAGGGSAFRQKAPTSVEDRFDNCASVLFALTSDLRIVREISVPTTDQPLGASPRFIGKPDADAWWLMRSMRP